MLFRNRSDAGKQLAGHLTKYADHGESIVIALPRGGAPVGYEIATALDAELDVLPVQNLETPKQGGFNRLDIALGAVAHGGVRHVDNSVVLGTDISVAELEAATADARDEVNRQYEVYRRGEPEYPLYNRVVILVDDGVAGLATLHAAIQAIEMFSPRRTVAAVPVMTSENVENMKRSVDELQVLQTPNEICDVGDFFEEFPQTTDEDVLGLLKTARSREIFAFRWTQ